MPKAYLKYVQHAVLGGLVSGNSDLEACSLYRDGEPLGPSLLSSCNEVTSFIDLKTRDQSEYYVQIDNKDAEHGFVTRFKSSGSRLAIGYSSGTVLVYDLDLAHATPDFDNHDQLSLKQLNKFSFHRSGVTCLLFDENDTMLYSAGQDTYIVVYDLVSERAQYKLMGHREQITDLQMFDLRNPYLQGKVQKVLISCSNDGFIKFWDLNQQSCLLSHSDEMMTKIQGMCFIPNLDAIVVGFGTEEKYMKIFKLFVSEATYMLDVKGSTLKKQSASKVVQMSYIDQHLVCLNSDNSIEIWKVGTREGKWQDAIIRKMERNEKRLALKRQRNQLEDDEEDRSEQGTSKPKIDKDKIKSQVKEGAYDLALHFSHLAKLDADQSQRISSFCLLMGGNQDSQYKLCLALPSTNQITCYNVNLQAEEQFKVAWSIGGSTNTQGCHAGPIRGAVLSGNDYLLVTNSFDCINIWSIDFNAAKNSLRMGLKQNVVQSNIYCTLILPGNKFVVLGSKEGSLMLLDVNEGKIVQTIDDAHKKEIWELAMHTSPQIKNSRGELLIASASGDHSVKFWNLVQSPSTGAVKLNLYEKIESTDEVMGVKFTPDGKYFVFSLLDQTMKVCYLDSMKLSLNLYGHTLPVLSFDISSDNTLLVSASADKNIKIWGLDFGDIHRSIFAHSDSITCVKFIKETHYLMSCSKDRTVKFFDGDTYDEVFVFEGFQSAVWSIAVSSIGDFFVAVGADKSIRVWRQTSEQAFLIEEKDDREDKQMLKEAEEEYHEIDVARQNQLDPFSKDKVIKLENAEAYKRTQESIKYGEGLMEALQLCEAFRDEVEQYAMDLEAWANNGKKGETPEKPRPSIMFLGHDIYEQMLLHLRRVRSTELENTLRFLNQRQSFQLLFYLEHNIRNNIEIERSSRAAIYIIKSYQVQLKQANQGLLHLLKSISLHMRHQFKQLRDEVGINICGLKLVQKEINETNANRNEAESGFGGALPALEFS